MTDPLQPYDSELLKRYDAELQELESLSPAAIELPPLQALAVITHLQMAAAKHIQESFNPESAIYEMLELGWNKPEISHEDVSHKIFTSVLRREERLRRPE